MAAKTNYPSRSRIQVATMRDFTGGLNLRADAFQLAPNESPDMLNVDVQIGGGFIQRRVAQPYASTVPAAVTSLWSFSVPSGTKQLLASTASGIYYSTGGAWTLIGSTAPSVGTLKHRTTVFKNAVYVENGTDAAQKWDGSTRTAMGAAWNNTIGGEGAADGNMPIASLIASHMGRVFVAGTTEGGVSFPNRIRWSHPNCPEDWRQQDFIDIDIGHDGDVITAIAEFRERLYIFKRNSMYVLIGYGTENFQVVPQSMDIGCVGQDAVVLTDVGLAHFSWPQGVYLNVGNGPYPIFDKVWPLIRDGQIPATYQSGISMGWVNRMIWCSIPYGASTTNTRTLVYNPWIWKLRYLKFLQGPWQMYDLPLGQYVSWYQPNGPALYLAPVAGGTQVVQLEQSGGQDNIGAGQVNINSYYRTNWFDAGQEAVKKRFRHPDLVMRAGTTGNLSVDVHKDYDPWTITKSYTVSQALPATSQNLVWDDGTGLVGGKWDDGSGLVGKNWTGNPAQQELVSRGASMGTGRAIQLTFTGPAAASWGIDAVTFKYIVKRIRG